LADHLFYIQSLGTRCLDVGGAAVGTPVVLASCNGTGAQQIRIKELDRASHDVELRVGAPFCLGVRGQQVTLDQPLEVQWCDGSPAQRFAFDGDALLLGTQEAGARVNRAYVLEPAQGRTAHGTPLVVGERDASDAEYFHLQAVDGSDRRPTSGFVRVEYPDGLDQALARGWGTVIEIVKDLTLTREASRTLQAGVTLRGDRKFLAPGPQLILTPYRRTPAAAFVIAADNVRITGLRLRGRSTPFIVDPWLNAIEVSAPFTQDPQVLLDHLEISHWPGAAIVLGSGHGGYRDVCPQPSEFLPEFYDKYFAVWPRPPTARVVGNFIHDNHYGVNPTFGAFVLVQGNVFNRNAHDVAADWYGHVGYAAYDNLLLTSWSTGTDFDVHGSLHPGHWYGGIAGDAFEIGWNTFVSPDRENVELRGTPCRFLAVHDNVHRQSQGDAFKHQSEDPKKVVIYDNIRRTAYPFAPSNSAWGDFDGDGVLDRFAGTGAGWYFSSGNRSAWRFLNRMPQFTQQLQFRDVDGDGRTDVLMPHGTGMRVSWAGGSPWQELPPPAEEPPAEEPPAEEPPAEEPPNCPPHIPPHLCHVQ
jgi:hypothetical protein